MVIVSGSDGIVDDRGIEKYLHPVRPLLGQCDVDEENQVVCVPAGRKVDGCGVGRQNDLGAISGESPVYAATDNGLRISTDGGTIFTATALSDSKVNGVSASGTKVYAATDRGVMVSTDGGPRPKV